MSSTKAGATFVLHWHGKKVLGADQEVGIFWPDTVKSIERSPMGGCVVEVAFLDGDERATWFRSAKGSVHVKESFSEVAGHIFHERRGQ